MTTIYPLQSTYTVKKGDCLSKIAKINYRNASLWSKIADANNLKTQLILVGQSLRLPPISVPDSPSHASHPVPVTGVFGVDLQVNGSTRALPPGPLGDGSGDQWSGSTGISALLEYGVAKNVVLTVTIPFKSDPIVIDTITYHAEIRLEGSLKLSRTNPDLAYDVTGELTLGKKPTLSVKGESLYKDSMNQISSSGQMTWDPFSKPAFGYTSGITTTTQINKDHFVQYEVNWKVSASLPPVTLIYKMTPTDVKGDYTYKAANGSQIPFEFEGTFGVTVEITPRIKLPDEFVLEVQRAGVKAAKMANSAGTWIVVASAPLIATARQWIPVLEEVFDNLAASGL